MGLGWAGVVVTADFRILQLTPTWEHIGKPGTVLASCPRGAGAGSAGPSPQPWPTSASGPGHCGFLPSPPTAYSYTLFNSHRVFTSGDFTPKWESPGSL